ncbi:MAG TPA: hypothetical protein VM344_01835 [Vitreimonas sp.]|nr:hypothetical protein [Vitreimonas sp.]
MRQPTEVRELDRDTLGVRKIVERLDDGRLVEFVRHFHPDVLTLELRSPRLLRERLRRTAATPDGVHRPAVDDRQEPRFQRTTARRVVTGVLPRREEGLLNGILGEPEIAGDPERDAVRRSPVEVVQLRQGLGPTLGEVLHEGSIRLARGVKGKTRRSGTDGVDE